MTPSTTVPIVALLCNEDGIIQQVVRDDVGLDNRLIPGRSWTGLIDLSGLTKALNFFQHILTQQAALGWELTVRMGEQIQLLHFTGGRVEGHVLIVGARSRLAAEDTYEAELLRINNEQTNALRATLKEHTLKLRMQSEHDSKVYEELTRLNNELTNLQRELARKNVELEEKQHLIQRILETTPDILYIYDVHTRCSVFVNQAITAVLGFAPQASPSTEPRLLNLPLHRDDTATVAAHLERCAVVADGEVLDVEYRIQDTTGQWRWMYSRDTVFTRDATGQPTHLLGAAQDITHRKEAEHKLWIMSTHDSLTGLYNRAYFEAEIQRWEQDRRYPISILIIDLDGLKAANDNLGHAVGDSLLHRAAQVLTTSVRAKDIVARLGGDEFGVLLLDTGAATAEQIILRMRTVLGEHNQHYPDLPLSFSIGTATVADGGLLSDALKQADHSMYAEKVAHKRQRTT